MFEFGATSNCPVKSKFTFSASINNLAASQNRNKRPAESAVKLKAGNNERPEASKPPRFAKPAPPPPPATMSTRSSRRQYNINDISQKDVDNLRNCLSSTRIEPPNLKELGIDIDLFDEEPIAKESRKPPVVEVFAQKKTLVDSVEQDKLRGTRSALSDMRLSSLRLLQETQLMELLSVPPKEAKIEEQIETIDEEELLLSRDNTNESVTKQEENIVPIREEMATMTIPSSPVMTTSPKCVQNEKKEEDQEYLKVTAFYRSLVVEKTKSLNTESDRWAELCEKKNEPGEAAPEDVEGEIRLACGLAKLLIDERFSQFSELIDQCEQSNSASPNPDPEVKLVKPTDLEGFWEMIYAQVINVEKQFAKLEKLRLNNYVYIEEAPKPRKAPIKVVKKPVAQVGEKKPSADKKSVRSRFADFRKNLDKKQEEIDVVNVPASSLTIAIQSKDVDQIVFVVKTPVTTPVTNNEAKSPMSARYVNVEEVLILEKENSEPKPEELKCDKVEVGPMPGYKSRVSDLIKFDSPHVMRRKSKRLSTRTYLASENNFVCKDDIIEENEGTYSADDADDMFGDLESKVHWRSKKNLETPPRSQRSKAQPDNVTCSAGAFKNISNSPLLKLALISSHGKRSSLAGARPSLNFN